MAVSTSENLPARVTTRSLQKIRKDGGNISMLTAYDYPTAEVLDEAGIDILLVGDSLAMVVQGHDTTLSVTMDDMIYHAKMVGRAAKRSMVVVDLPFPEGQLEIMRSVEAGARVLKETTCHAVKLRAVPSRLNGSKPLLLRGSQSWPTLDCVRKTFTLTAVTGFNEICPT